MSEPKANLPIPKMNRGAGSFFADLKRELKKVSWPTTKETNRLFGVVIAVCVLLAAVMGILGFAFDLLVTLITKSGAK
jgi:preprotein translocase SecE subunit